MRYATSKDKTTRQSEKTSPQGSAAGRSAVSIAPPEYGIDFVDRRTADTFPPERVLDSEGFGVLQAKMILGPPGDKYENEADAMARKVMSMPEPRVQRQEEDEEEELRMKPLAGQVTPFVQKQSELDELKEEEGPLQTKLLDGRAKVRRESLEEEEEEVVNAKAADGRTPGITSGLEARINSMLSSGGRPLDSVTRAFMEPRFGYDFREVRVHTGNRAAESARALNARAFTIGRNVAFGAGEYTPGKNVGRRLLAHELTHVLQQDRDNRTNPGRGPLRRRKRSRRRATDVRPLQAALNRILGLGLAVDGILGPQTQRAIRRFQLINGLAVDGIVGPKTRAALKAALRGALPTHGPAARTPGAPSPPYSLGEPRVTIDPRAVVSERAVRILKRILRMANLSSAVITSGFRDPQNQARVMYEYIKSKGVYAAKRLYGRFGDMVIDVYVSGRSRGWSGAQIKRAMERKIIVLGPANVSRHGSVEYDVIDVGPKSSHYTAQENLSFHRAARQAKRSGLIDRYLGPYTRPRDPAHHIEIKK